MSKVFSYKCNMCPQTRGPANHWLLILISAGKFVITPWDENEATRDDISHACGFECANKLFAQTVQSFYTKLKSISDS